MYTSISRHPAQSWRSWIVFIGSCFYWGFSDWFMYRLFGVGLYIVLTTGFFTLQWWLLMPHPDGLRWIIGSTGVWIMTMILIGYWIDPLLFTYLTTLHETVLARLSRTTIFMLHQVLVGGLMGFMVGIVQAWALPASYRRGWWIVLATLAASLAGLRILVLLS